METEPDALDAYSRIVTTAAGYLLPSVAALAVRSRRGTGAGSAVTSTDDAEASFDVVGADQLSDLAVLRVRATRVPTAPLGDADELRVGRLVVAVGNPMGIRWWRCTERPPSSP